MMGKNKIINLQTSRDTLQFDSATGRLVSFRSKSAPDQEFITSKDDDPAFIIQYLDEKRRFRQIASNQAAKVEVKHDAGQEGAGALTADFRRLGGVDIDVTATVRASKNDEFSYWSFSLRNGTDLTITDVQFPFIISPYNLAGAPGTEVVVWPYGAGALVKEPKPHELRPDCPHTWQMRPENGDFNHYPGYTVAQFLAYYNDRAGVYVSCQDPSGMIKLIQPVHHEPGLRLGISHIGDWPKKGERKLGYDVAVGSFKGDWYAAADLYRNWSLKQKWAGNPLHARKDVPSWLLESPPHIILRIQGELDIGPTLPKTEFLPYAKAIPLLEKLAKYLEAPLVPVIMSWERPGPWIYPDCFPPAGGDESLREFTKLARDRGWHIGTFCNGTRWVVGHHWSGYDGEDYFNEKGGAKSVCRTHAGDIWKENWDQTWRPSYPGCMGTSMTREIATDFVRRVVDDGLDWVQFLDQNVGCATFPCFAEDHEHPPVPGKWMIEKMGLLVDSFHELARKEGERSRGNRQVIYSVEGPVNECFLPSFQICDIRVVPPGHNFGSFWRGFIPLYHFLYHEFILIQGGFGSAPEPYHLPIRNAYNLVVGEIPGAVMKGDGTLLNMDTMNWAPWDVEVGDNDDALYALRSGTALRRGPAKDFLVYGRMLSPAKVENIKIMQWQHDGKDHQIPAVFHAAWQAPDGRFGIVLANWTTEIQKVRVSDSRLGRETTQHTSMQGLDSKTIPVAGDGLSISLPPLSCALLESRS